MARRQGDGPVARISRIVQRWPGRWRTFTTILGFGALFSGVALLTNIIAGFWLPLALLVLVSMLAIVVVTALRRARRDERAQLLTIAATGAACGLVATLSYDAAKYALSQFDPSPYNPFEAARVFGTLFLGESAPPLAVHAIGWTFHFLNGTSFGLAYCFLFAREGQTSIRWALLTGMGWGLFLEMFQLTLYPGWLDIRFYQEFVQISFLGHLVYGSVLGLACRYGLRRTLMEDLL